MANAAGDAHEFPIYGYHFRVTFPILDNTGSLVTGAAGLDSEFSNDAGTFADCTNEATELATSSGVYYLDLIGTEMDAKQVAVIVKTSTSNAKTTTIVLYPERLVALATGTAQAGGASTITLAASTSKVDNDLAGLYVGITNNGAAGSQYQVRKIISNVASTQVATVDSAWGTNPSSASTYELLSRSTANISSFAGTMPPTIATAGIQDVNAVKMSNTTLTGRDIGASVLLSAGTGTGQLDFTSGVVKANVTQLLGTAWLTPGVAGTPDVNVKLIGGQTASASGTITFPNATLASTTNITAGTITTATNVTTVNGLAANVITAAATASDFGAEMATAIWTDTTAGDFTVALSVGKSLMNGVSLGTGLTVARCTLTDTLTTYTGNTPQTGDSFARIGATGSGLTSLAPSSTALSTAQWTNTLATNLGTTNSTVATNLDTTVSSRSTLTQTQVSGGAYALNSSSFAFNAALDFTTTQKAATLARVTLVDTVTTLTNLPAITAGWLTATGIAADAITAAKVAADVGTEIGGAVWDIVLASHLTSGTTGAALNAAGSAGDPWSTALPGAYGAGTAGFIVGTNLNATVSSRLASASYTAPTNLTAAQIATGVWQDATAGDFTTAGSIGKDLKTGAVPGASGGLFISGTNTDVVLTSLQVNGSTSLNGTVTFVAGLVGNITGNLSGSVGSVTGNVGGNVVGTVAGVTPATNAGVLAAALTESYAADGAAFTLTQALYQIWSLLAEKSVSGTTVTCKKLDGSTTSMTLTLNDATDPSSITRAS